MIMIVSWILIAIDANFDFCAVDTYYTVTVPTTYTVAVPDPVVYYYVTPVEVCFMLIL